MNNSRYPVAGTLTLLVNDPVGDWTAAAQRGRRGDYYGDMYGEYSGDPDSDRDSGYDTGRITGIAVREAFPSGGYFVTNRADWYNQRSEAKATGRDTLDRNELRVRDGKSPVLGSSLVVPGGDEMDVRTWSRLRRP
jgi:hypothetical protein